MTIRELLRKRIQESEEGVASLQLQIGGMLYAGGVRESEDGLFELLTLGKQPDGSPYMIKCTFADSDVQIIFEPFGEEPALAKPKGGIIIPGAH